MIVHSRIYLVKDIFGNTASAACEENCDIIQICGLKKKDGSPSYFESEAYHLTQHCKDDGLQFKEIENIQDFDKLWG